MTSGPNFLVGLNLKIFLKFFLVNFFCKIFFDKKFFVEKNNFFENCGGMGAP